MGGGLLRRAQQPQLMPFPSHVLPFTPLPTNPTVCKWEGSVHRRSIKTVISLTVSLTYNQSKYCVGQAGLAGLIGAW